MVNLFLLPFAGGSAHSYSPFIKYAPIGIKVIPIELPGRGKRVHEPLISNVYMMVNDMLDQISKNIKQPYAIFGHSMGGTLGYLLLKQIIKRGLPEPVHLFISGAGGPSLHGIDKVLRHKLSTKELKSELRKLGGFPLKLLDDKDFFKFYEPVLRADFEAIEKFQYKASKPFSIPVTVIIGKEENLSVDEVLAWERETESNVSIYYLPGDHFFILGNEKKILSIIKNHVLGANT